jgi:hypothetical protein
MTAIEQSVSLFVDKKTLKDLIEQIPGDANTMCHFSVTLFMNGDVRMILIPANKLVKGLLTLHPEGKA